MVEKQVVKKIRESDVQKIRANIDTLKEELRTLRNAKASSGSASKLAKIKGVRKNIARNLTILNQKERTTAAGSLHAQSSKRALFLRTKLTVNEYICCCHGKTTTFMYINYPIGKIIYQIILKWFSKYLGVQA